MASIAIRDLHVAGLDLFLDQESYLNEVANEEFELVHGGATPALIPVSVAFVRTVIVSISFTIATDRATWW